MTRLHTALTSLAYQRLDALLLAPALVPSHFRQEGGCALAGQHWVSELDD